MIEQKKYFGFKSTKFLKDILIKNKSKNIFLVTGEKSYELCGAKQVLTPLLKAYNVIKFSDFEKNPKIDDVKKGIKLFKEKRRNGAKGSR